MATRIQLPRALATLVIAAVAAIVAVPLTAGNAAAASPICLSGNLQYDY